jgi:hypothetical protein
VKEILAQIFYETDVIKISQHEFSVDFSHMFSSPEQMEHIARYAATEIDDYAIDALVASDECLPFLSMIAKLVNLPFLWLSEKGLRGKIGKIKRVMYISAVTPTEKDLDTLSEFFSEPTTPELVGCYSFLGLNRDTEKTRLPFLISLIEVLEIYSALHLISEKEYKHLLMLQNEKND